MDDFTGFPPENVDRTAPEFGILGVKIESWDSMFRGNPERRKELIPKGNWSYDAYGEVISVRPVVVDFGDLQFEIGDFTSDRRCIGEFIQVTIDLYLTFRTRARSEPGASPNGGRVERLANSGASGGPPVN